jgi:hypothetical protein
MMRVARPGGHLWGCLFDSFRSRGAAAHERALVDRTRYEQRTPAAWASPAHACMAPRAASAVFPCAQDRARRLSTPLSTPAPAHDPPPSDHRRGRLCRRRHVQPPQLGPERAGLCICHPGGRQRHQLQVRRRGCSRFDRPRQADERGGAAKQRGRQPDRTDLAPRRYPPIPRPPSQP